MDRRIVSVVGAVLAASLLIAVWTYILQARADSEATKARAAEYAAAATTTAWQLEVTQTASANAAQATRSAQTAVAAQIQTSTAVQAVYQQTAEAQETATAAGQAAEPTQTALAQEAALASWLGLPNGQCLMQVPGHDATILVRGHGAAHECSLLGQGTYGDFGSYVVGPSVSDYDAATNTVTWKDQDGYSTSVHHICHLSYPPVTIDVFDSGGLAYGTEICNSPLSYLTVPAT